MKFLIPAIKTILWASLMSAFLRYVTLSQDNRLSYQPDWFSGDVNSCLNGSCTLIGYTNPGFPIQIDGGSTDGPYWLAWTINIAFAVIIGILLALILRKLQFKKS